MARKAGWLAGSVCLCVACVCVLNHNTQKMVAVSTKCRDEIIRDKYIGGKSARLVCRHWYNSGIKIPTPGGSSDAHQKKNHRRQEDKARKKQIETRLYPAEGRNLEQINTY